MKTKLIFILSFSLFFGVFNCQKSDSLKLKKFTYQPNFTVGFDVLNAGMSFFSDKKLYQGFVSSKITKNIHGIFTAGFEENTYDKSSYLAHANGAFLKIGAFYMMAMDQQNLDNGFYAGGNFAGSLYSQEYLAVPIRGYGGGDYTEAFPESNQSTFWLEANVGGRVQLFESQFLIDVSIQPKYILYTSKQDQIFPMIVPGFGSSSSKFNLGFMWSLAYKF